MTQAIRDKIYELPHTRTRWYSSRGMVYIHQILIINIHQEVCTHSSILIVHIFQSENTFNSKSTNLWSPHLSLSFSLDTYLCVRDTIVRNGFLCAHGKWHIEYSCGLRKRNVPKAINKILIWAFHSRVTYNGTRSRQVSLICKSGASCSLEDSNQRRERPTNRRGKRRTKFLIQEYEGRRRIQLLVPLVLIGVGLFLSLVASLSVPIINLGLFLSLQRMSTVIDEHEQYDTSSAVRAWQTTRPIKRATSVAKNTSNLQQRLLQTKWAPHI